MVIPDESTPAPGLILLFPLITQRSIVIVDVESPSDTPPPVWLVIDESLMVRCTAPTPNAYGPVLSSITHLSTVITRALIPPPVFCLTIESLIYNVAVDEIADPSERFP